MVELGLLPSPVKPFLESIQLHGNPYGIPAKKRSDWMEGFEVEDYKDQEFLYYVGCEGSYDTRAQFAAKALGTLLSKAGVSFGVLGNNEITDGNEVEMLGEDGLMEWVADKNIKQFTFGRHQFIYLISR